MIPAANEGDHSAGLLAAPGLASRAANRRVERIHANALVRMSGPGRLRAWHRDSRHDDAAVVFGHACRLGLEGIVSKRRGSRYVSGRSTDWIKLKNPKSPAVRREAEEDWS